METEINGLLTYDRITKVDPAQIRKANLFQYPPVVYKPVVPTSEETAQTWKYTTNSPTPDWNNPDFDDSGWQEGAAGFGKVRDRGNTPWKTTDIWLRRHFNPGELTEAQISRLLLRVFNDEDVQVSINGVWAFGRDGYVTSYSNHAIRPEARKAIRPNADNVLSVHCKQTVGEQYIDAGIYERVSPER